MVDAPRGPECRTCWQGLGGENAMGNKKRQLRGFQRCSVYLRVDGRFWQSTRQKKDLVIPHGKFFNIIRFVTCMDKQ